jgi:hypothetical protein
MPSLKTASLQKLYQREGELADDNLSASILAGNSPFHMIQLSPSIRKYDDVITHPGFNVE